MRNVENGLGTNSGLMRYHSTATTMVRVGIISRRRRFLLREACHLPTSQYTQGKMGRQARHPRPALAESTPAVLDSALGWEMACLPGMPRMRLMMPATGVFPGKTSRPTPCILNYRN